MDLVGAEEAPIGIKKPKADYTLILGMDFYNYKNDTNLAFPKDKFPMSFSK